MERKALVALGMVAALAVGIFIGMAFNTAAPAAVSYDVADPDSRRESNPTTAPDTEATQLRITRGSSAGEQVQPESSADVERLAADLARETQTSAQLRQQVETLESEIAAWHEEQAARKPAFTFGRYGEIDGVRNSNWRELSEANSNVIEAIREIRAAQRKGERPPRDASIRLQRNTEIVRKYEYETIGVIKTWARHNGELTHPLTVVNFFAGALADAGMPLSEQQKDAIEKLGLDFEAEWDEAQKIYGSNTPRCEKMLDEYLLKGKFIDRLYELLTPEQRAHLIDPATHRRASCDLHCPTLMLIHTTAIVAGKDGAELKTWLAEALDQRFKIGESQQPALQLLLDSWLADVSSILSPVPQAETRFYTYDEGATALRGTVKLFQGLRDTIVLEETARAALLDSYEVFVPRIVQ